MTKYFSLPLAIWFVNCRLSIDVPLGGGWAVAGAAVRMRLVRFESDENRTDHHDNAANLAHEIVEFARLGVLVHEPLRRKTEH